MASSPLDIYGGSDSQDDSEDEWLRCYNCDGILEFVLNLQSCVVSL